MIDDHDSMVILFDLVDSSISELFAFASNKQRYMGRTFNTRILGLASIQKDFFGGES